MKTGFDFATFQPPSLVAGLKNKTHTLNIKAAQNSAGRLKAPVDGQMNRIIKESAGSVVEAGLFENSGNRLFSGKGVRAGLEIIEKILTYL